MLNKSSFISLFLINVQIFCNNEPLLVAVLMVKNEEAVMARTLKPFVEGGIKHFLIFDTGSTDKTVEVTQNFFKQNKISVNDLISPQAVIKQEPFINYAESRNRALELAEESFNKAVFFVMLDAEWYLNDAAGLLQFCKQHKNEKFPVYQICVSISGGIMLHATRLIRCSARPKFIGERHECINCVDYGPQVPKEIYFSHEPNEHGNKKSIDRSRRDCEFFKKKYDQDPSDPRNSYYLAQAYFFLEDWENSRIWLEKRLKIKGDPEEDYIVEYRLGYVYQNMNNWDKALYHYLQCFNKRPWRAETLVRIADHYLKEGNLPLCYLFARQAMDIPFPDQDKILIEKNMYDFLRYDLVGCSAASVGEFKIGQEAVRMALKAQPDSQILKNNLEWYKKNSK